MACGGCKRRKELAKNAWHQATRKTTTPGTMSGGIGRKTVTTGSIAGRVKVLTK